jgi:hypothetical protein
MNAKHTPGKYAPEPWTTRVAICDNDFRIMSGKEYVGSVCEGFKGTDGKYGSTANRIVACVNALAGIENPAEAIAEARTALRRILQNEPACECLKKWKLDTKGEPRECSNCHARRALAALSPKGGA